MALCPTPYPPPSSYKHLKKMEKIYTLALNDKKTLANPVPFPA
jgi:hypothetical protein